MNDPVDKDLNDYMATISAEEYEEAWRDRRSRELGTEWMKELNETLHIADEDLDQDDVFGLMDKYGTDSGLEALTQHAYERITADPDLYREDE